MSLTAATLSVHPNPFPMAIRCKQHAASSNYPHLAQNSPTVPKAGPGGSETGSTVRVSRAESTRPTFAIRDGPWAGPKRAQHGPK